MFNSSLRGPVPSLHVATPLQLQHITSVAYNHLASIQALQNSLSQGCNTEFMMMTNQKLRQQVVQKDARITLLSCSTQCRAKNVQLGGNSWIL